MCKTLQIYTVFKPVHLFIGTSVGVDDDASDSEPVVRQSAHTVAQLDHSMPQFMMMMERDSLFKEPRFCSGTPTTPYPPNTRQNSGVSDPTNNATCIHQDSTENQRYN
uniref:Uncharacterized protein n=1 Tax=Caenorhabditis tropicalis TaxID=1561998 RepID=A0A1I7U1S1_9PELO